MNITVRVLSYDQEKKTLNVEIVSERQDSVITMTVPVQQDVDTTLLQAARKGKIILKQQDTNATFSALVGKAFDFTPAQIKE